MSHYFEKFEERTPPEPVETHPGIHSAAQILLIIAIVTGAWYIHWRWTESLNYDALWFSLPLVIAETGAFIGLILFVFNIYKVQDIPKQPAPECISDCYHNNEYGQRPITVDIFFPTYDEDIELVKLSLQDAANITYPHPIEQKIHVLDDGNRPAMAELAASMGCNYITRDNNIGFKAGNMRNAMEQTSGDFIVICDADTRPFPTILQNTLGYFRDPDVAWVQTPQWFFDLPEGKTLTEYLGQKAGKYGSGIGAFIENIFGEITIGKDPFVNDPKLFYDVILRRRNWANAAFCCGAGSVHRREAVMQSALRSYSNDIAQISGMQSKKLSKATGEDNVDSSLVHYLNAQAMKTEEFTPYKFHVSEDIFTSIELHSDTQRHWKSVQHPNVESKMLSPQDLETWTVQRFKYAGGTLDIALHDNLIFKKGLSTAQRMMYTSTVWSYFGGVWNTIFLISPIIFMLFAVAPVDAYSHDFYKHIFPFLVATELGTLLAFWGISGLQAKNNYLAFFPVNLRALWTVLRGKKISFPVTSKTRQIGTYGRLVRPQIAVVALTLIAICVGWTRYFIGGTSYSLDGMLINTFWGLNNILAMAGMIKAAYWKPDDSVDTNESPMAEHWRQAA